MSSEYLDAPFLDPAIYLEALRLLQPKPQPRALRVPAARISGREQKLLRQESAVAEAAWTERGFIDVDRDVWLAAGIRRHDAHIAEQCVRFGVTPSMLDIEVQGRKARVWLRSGESVTAVRARLLEASDGSIDSPDRPSREQAPFDAVASKEAGRGRQYW